MPYTSALFVAIPASDDPVNEIAPEAHVTLTYFGEAETLPEQMLAALEVEILRVSQRFAPFSVDVAGTAILGPDKASVLLLESFSLVEIRGYLREAPEVLEAELNAEKRYPSFIPHLTVTYDGPPPEEPPAQIRFDSLGFWAAGEQTTYPLTGSDTAMMASAVCLPEISCEQDLDLGLRYASAHAEARWYVMKRAVALGAGERIPNQWSRV